MPIPVADRKTLSRQFFPCTDTDYGYFNALSVDDFDKCGGTLWYNKQKQIAQLRRIFLTGPTAWSTEIKADTLVLSISAEYEQPPPPYVESKTFSRLRSRVAGPKPPPLPAYAYGIWFGSEESRFNVGRVLDRRWQWSLPEALLGALDEALEIVLGIVERDRLIRDIKVQTDSEWLTRVFAWGEDVGERARSAGWTREQGGAHISYDELLRSYDGIKERWETLTMGGGGRKVELWVVDHVAEPRRLAEVALRECESLV